MDVTLPDDPRFQLPSVIRNTTIEGGRSREFQREFVRIHSENMPGESHFREMRLINVGTRTISAERAESSSS
jgi:hypothetical protein